MDKLTFKDFTWPTNPSVYKEEYIRNPRFRIVEGLAYYDGMGKMHRRITGSGVFFGTGAYAQFRKLGTLFEDDTPGYLDHPEWGVRHCYFTGLKLTQEPKENCVSYQFEFTEAMANGEIAV